MDSITRSVRDLYEAYPYPSGAPETRVGFDARYVLSLVDAPRASAGPIEVLDAGCGRALGLIGAAQLQPGVAFTGVDLNRPALAEALDESLTRGLQNVRFQEVDLTTLDGLTVPAGGFDVIHSSGVIHHMPDPASALATLRGVLAPGGVIVLMVYARAGRQGYARVTRAIDALIAPDAPLAERLAVGRAVVEPLAAESPWREAAACDDVEFVDRYLHVQEACFDVSGLLDLVEQAGLRPIDWCEPENWALDRLPPALRERAEGLSRQERWAFMEPIVEPRMFELYLTHHDVPSRRALTGAAAAEEWFALNPEGTIELRTRAMLGELRNESLTFRLRLGEPAPFAPGPVAAAALLLRDQIQPFRGSDFVAGMNDAGFSNAAAGQALGQLLRMGVLFRPHATDLAPA